MILIHPYSKKLRPPKQDQLNAKTFHEWRTLVDLLNKKDIIQIGVDGENKLVPDFRKNLSLKDISKLVISCDYWISCDSFLPHLAHHLEKPGVVIWSLSDPNIFGYLENLNLLKDRKYLRKNQFNIWEEQPFIKEAFLSPEEIFKEIQKWRA